MSKRLLNRRQVRWSEFLTRFDYEIVYRPGKSNGKADALPRRPGDLPEGGDERLKSMKQVILKPENLPKQLQILENEMEAKRTIQQPLKEPSERDELVGEILGAVREGRSVREITIEECSAEDGQLYSRGKRYVPEDIQLRRWLIEEYHNTPLAGHPGRSKTFDLLSQQYYWKEMRRQVDRYVRNYAECQKSRMKRHASFGVLAPLSVPEKPWQDISIDFVTGLPECEGYDGI
jgi:hypothetical protein